MVALNTAYAAPKNAADPKNRVGNFFYEDHASVGKNRWASRLNAQEKSCYHYETASGRSNWPNRDPIEEAGGINLYAMVHNNPIDYWDFIGLQQCRDCNAEHDACYANAESAKDQMVDDARATRDFALDQLSAEEAQRRSYCDSLDDGTLIGVGLSLACHATTSAVFGTVRLEVRAVYAGLVATANALETLSKNQCDGELRACVRDVLANPCCQSNN